MHDKQGFLLPSIAKDFTKYKDPKENIFKIISKPSEPPKNIPTKGGDSLETKKE